MMGVRDEQVWALYGQEKNAGAVDGPLYPLNGASILVASIGADNVQSGSAAGTVKNGTLAAAVQGATSLTYTVTNTTPAPVANDIIQIGPVVSTFGAAALSAGATFVTKITSVTGTGPYVLTVPPIPAAVAANAVAQAVQAPFFHNLNPTNTLNSLTLEKNIGGFQSEQFAGCRVNKYSLKLGATNTEAAFTADVIGQGVTVLSSPNAVTIDSAAPFVFAEATVTILGQASVPVANIQLDLENGLKDGFTLGSSHDLTYLTPTTRKASGTASIFFQSLNDSNVGFFVKMRPGTSVQGVVTLTLAHPTSGGSVSLTLPQVNISKYTDEIKLGDAVMISLGLEASMQLSNSQTISGYIANSQNTAF